MKHYKSVEFLPNFQCQAPCKNVKPPYWRLSGDSSDGIFTSIWTAF